MLFRILPFVPVVLGMEGDNARLICGGVLKLNVQCMLSS